LKNFEKFRLSPILAAKAGWERRQKGFPISENPQRRKVRMKRALILSEALLSLQQRHHGWG
jgi:hypothetical protein